MNKLLLVIDMQQSFINEETISTVKNINDLIDSNTYSHVVFTKFINDFDSIWYKELKFDGCIFKEDRKMVIDPKDNLVIAKDIYSALNKELKSYIKDNKIKEIYLCGIDTECCVLKTALDLFEAGYNVYVLKDYCGCMNGIKSHNYALDILRRTIGKDRVI